MNLLVVTVTSEQNFYSPLKVGLLIVTVVFFMFTLHGILTMEWWGEWEIFPEGSSIRFWLFVTDISSVTGLMFRFVGSLIATIAIGFYFIKKGLSTPTTLKLLKIILVMEAIYWFSFISSGIWGFTPIVDALLGTPIGSLSFVISTGIPCLFEAIVLPIALVKIFTNLSPTKPLKGAIKWGLIAGTGYIFVWWLNNTGIWISTTMYKGTEYLTAYPQNMISFVSTVFGLLALGIFTAYFSKKSIRTEKLGMLKLKTVGLIIVLAGLYFLWNYVTGIIFGAELWSDWYAWFLGHNLDLWALSLPLLGLPLLFKKRS